jgi:hypothetical protein
MNVKSLAKVFAIQKANLVFQFVLFCLYEIPDEIKLVFIDLLSIFEHHSTTGKNIQSVWYYRSFITRFV